jgi:hypothetical protein
MKMEIICSSETSVHTLTTQRYVPEDANSHSYCCVNLKSYKKYICGETAHTMVLLRTNRLERHAGNTGRWTHHPGNAADSRDAKSKYRSQAKSHSSNHHECTNFVVTQPTLHHMQWDSIVSDQ